MRSRSMSRKINVGFVGHGFPRRSEAASLDEERDNQIAQNRAEETELLGRAVGRSPIRSILSRRHQQLNAFCLPSIGAESPHSVKACSALSLSYLKAFCG